MDDVHLHVHPAPYGWTLEAGGELLQPVLFRSAAQAEAQAHAVAYAFACAGQGACVQMYDRLDHLVGTTRYRARSPRGLVGQRH